MASTSSSLSLSSHRMRGVGLLLVEGDVSLGCPEFLPSLTWSFGVPLYFGYHSLPGLTSNWLQWGARNFSPGTPIMLPVPRAISLYQALA